MKKYEKYKVSGVEWLGGIPDHWECKTLKRITRFAYGDSLSEENRKEGTIPVYGSNGIVGYHNISITDSPCIIVGRKGSFGKVNFSEKPCFPIDTAYFIDKSQTKVNLYWLAYYLSILKLDENTLDDTVPGLSREWAYKKPGLIVPILEQQTIVRFLDYKTEQIDRFISNRQKQIELLSEKKAVIINNAVTGKAGLGTKVKMKPSGIEWLPEIPKNWDVCKIRRVLVNLTDFSSNGSFAGLAENVKYLDLPDYSRLIRLTDLRENLKNQGIYVNKEAHEYLKKSELHGGEILMANVGAYAGYVCLMPKINFKATLGPNMSLLKFDEFKITPQYIHTLLNSDIYYKLLMNKALSSAQPKLNKEDIKSISIAFPSSIKEQEKILNHIQTETKKIDTLISKYKKQIDLMQEYRTALISQAVTGKIDVRDWKPKERRKNHERNKRKAL